MASRLFEAEVFADKAEVCKAEVWSGPAALVRQDAAFRIHSVYGRLGLSSPYCGYRMDSRPVVWDATNIRHLERDHPERGIVRAEVNEALNDPERLEIREVRRDLEYHTVIGRTARGRVLVVVWVDHPGGRFPVHARPAGRRAARRYYR